MSTGAPISGRIHNHGAVGSAQLIKQTTIQPVAYSKDHLFYSKCHTDAENLSKVTYEDERGREVVKESNASYELCVIERTDNRTEDIVGQVNDFRTGIKIFSPPGYFAQITGNTELTYAGYMIPNSPLIIQPDNNDEIIVPLLKFVDLPDLELVFSGLQVTLHPINYCLTRQKMAPSQQNGYNANGYGGNGYGGNQPQYEEERPRQRRAPNRGRRSHMA